MWTGLFSFENVGITKNLGISLKNAAWMKALLKSESEEQEAGSEKALGSRLGSRYEISALPII